MQENERQKSHCLANLAIKLCHFKMDLIKWQLNFGSWNFGLKSYLWFQIELALRARSIWKSRVWFQTKLHSTQINYHLNSLTLFWLAESLQWIFEISARDFITAYYTIIAFKGTVSQTAHVQVINQKWSDVFKFVICETKWRQQAEDNPHSYGGRRNNSGRKKSRRRIRLEENIYTSCYRPNLKPRTVQQVTASSRWIYSR